MSRIKTLREKTGLSQSKFALKFDIPVKTLQAWEQERQDPPKYVISMIEKIINFEDKERN